MQSFSWCTTKYKARDDGNGVKGKNKAFPWPLFRLWPRKSIPLLKILYFLNNYHRNMNKVVTTLLVLQILHSSVHSVGHHGDICHDQIDCSDSGDPHLHCTLTNDGNRCLCRTHFQLTTEVDSGKIRCTNNTPIKLNKMKPMNKETRLLVDNETRQKTSIWMLETNVDRLYLHLWTLTQMYKKMCLTPHGYFLKEFHLPCIAAAHVASWRALYT